jgi:hypothetical protein
MKPRTHQMQMKVQQFQESDLENLESLGVLEGARGF